MNEAPFASHIIAKGNDEVFQEPGTFVKGFLCLEKFSLEYDIISSWVYRYRNSILQLIFFVFLIS